MALVGGWQTPGGGARAPTAHFANPAGGAQLVASRCDNILPMTIGSSMLWSDFRLLSGTRSPHRPATRTAHTHVYTCTQGHKGGPVRFVRALGTSAASLAIKSNGGRRGRLARPARITRVGLPPSSPIPIRCFQGIADHALNLLRLAVGIEAPDDLWNDLEAALDSVRLTH